MHPGELCGILYVEFLCSHVIIYSRRVEGYMLQILKKMNLLLDKKQKRKMVGIVFMMLIGGVLESLGVTMIIPVLQVLVDPACVEKNAYFAAIYQFLHLQSPVQFAVVMMIGLILVFVLKNSFLFLQNVVQLRFIYTNQFATSRRMMINFMKRPYEYYLNAETSVIQRNITSDVNNMYGLILSVLQLTSECVVFVCLVFVLLFQDAKMILCIAALLLLVLLIIKVVLKPIMVRAGVDNQNFYSGLFKWIEQSVMGIKEIKIANKENYFIKEYAVFEIDNQTICRKCFSSGTEHFCKVQFFCSNILYVYSRRIRLFW